MLLAAQPRGNIALSPHALVRGILALGARGDERQRAALRAFLGYSGAWGTLLREVDAAEARLVSSFASTEGGVPASRVQYESLISELSHAASLAPFTTSLQSAFNRSELARTELGAGRFVSLVDARIAGVPMLASPAFRAAQVPFGPGGRQVSLRFRAPTFCAATRFSLSTLAPELQRSLANELTLSARVAFDERGTINLPEQAVASPSFLNDLGQRNPRHELSFTHPFVVTVHDPVSGAIIYVAYVREPNGPSACR